MEKRNVLSATIYGDADGSGLHEDPRPESNLLKETGVYLSGGAKFSTMGGAEAVPTLVPRGGVDGCLLSAKEPLVSMF